MPVAIKLENRYRNRKEFTADLIVYGVKVGRVERGLNQGGRGDGARGESLYMAKVEGVTVAMAHTLSDLKADIWEWIEDERQMEHDAAWLLIARATGQKPVLPYYMQRYMPEEI
jgi:hypothetical protein